MIRWIREQVVLVRTWTALGEEERGLLRGYEGKEITLGVRPEDVGLGEEAGMRVFSNENLGMNTLVHGHLGTSSAPADKISAKMRGWCDYKEGDTVNIAFRRKHFFDKETTNAIRKEGRS